MLKTGTFILLILSLFIYLPAGEVAAADPQKPAIKENRIPARELFRRGRIYYMRGDFLKAKISFAALVKREPKNAEAWHYLGGAKHHLGDFTGAIADYSRAIDLSPGAYHSWHNRALSKHHSRKLGAAIEDYSKAISINRDYFRSWYFRGVAKFEKGDYRGAVEDFKVLLVMRPYHYKAWYVMGLAKFLSGDREGAAADLNQAIRLANKKLPSYDKKINPFSIARRGEKGKSKPVGEKGKTKGKAKSF